MLEKFKLFIKLIKKKVEGKKTYWEIRDDLVQISQQLKG